MHDHGISPANRLPPTKYSSGLCGIGRDHRYIAYGARCQQVGELGGDCYDFVPLPHNRLALAVADASGKGLAAALMIANVQSSLRTAASFAENDAAAVLGAVNRQVYASSLADRYASLFYGVFDGTTRSLPVRECRPQSAHGSSRRRTSRSPGSNRRPTVGMFADCTYEESAVQLDPGDLVLAYTDGVIEAVNPAGEEWGVEGLRRAAAESKAHNALTTWSKLSSHRWTNFPADVRRMMPRSWSCECVELDVSRGDRRGLVQISFSVGFTGNPPAGGA